MSDILARLADRALDAAGGLRPRLPARFEPAAGERPGPFIDRSVATGPETEGVEAEGEPAAVRSAQAGPATSPPVARDAEDPPRTGAAAGWRRAPPAPNRPPTIEARPTQPALAQPAGTPDEGPLPRSGPPPRAAAMGAARSERDARGSVPAALAADRNGESAPPLDRTAAAALDRPPPRRHESTGVRSQPDDRETVAEDRAPKERPRRVAARLAGTGEAPSAPVPLPGAPGVSGMQEPAVPVPARGERPVVHVSIGRIEVRAVTPPAQATPRRPGTPTAGPSLEAYLRARNGSTR